MIQLKCICGSEIRSPKIGEVWACVDNGHFYLVNSPPYQSHPWWGAQRIDTVDLSPGKIGCDTSAHVALWAIAVQERRWFWYADSLEDARSKLFAKVKS